MNFSILILLAAFLSVQLTGGILQFNESRFVLTVKKQALVKHTTKICCNLNALVIFVYFKNETSRRISEKILKNLIACGTPLTVLR